MPSLDERRLGFGSNRFRYATYSLGFMLRASTKLDWTIAVIVRLHHETAAAFAVPTALPVVPGEIAVVTVAHASPNLPLMRLRAFDASHL